VAKIVVECQAVTRFFALNSTPISTWHLTLRQHPSPVFTYLSFYANPLI